MNAKQLKQLETSLWNAADQLRANSKLTASEYSMPVLGLIFLRHAFNRYIMVKEEIEKDLPLHPERGKCPLNKNDFLAKNAMYLPEVAQFDYLVHLEEDKNTGEAINQAMKAIEDEHENLVGVLPRNYTIFDNELLRELLRIFNAEVLQNANGDIFGKIYEYFLNKFAMSGAQEGGEFFTPFSLVNTIVNVIEPDHGVVLDPAVGSAGMFVQTGYFITQEGFSPADKVTFFGQDKTETNTKLAKMNLAVHGLEGKILEGNTFYEDKHDLAGACDFVMANPPFNVNNVDKNKDFVKQDPRLPFGLPKNDNANYLWIQYFYSYLKPTGRAGFVMASSASDAGHSEKEIRKKLVETGAVDVMMAIGNNFFYTRSLPCTLWFFDRAKENDPERKNKILMLDARKIFRKVTQKINDFSPEQLQNLMCIVALYRGDNSRLKKTLEQYYLQCERLILSIGCDLEGIITASEALIPNTLEYLNHHSHNEPLNSYLQELSQIQQDTIWGEIKNFHENCVVFSDRQKIGELAKQAESFQTKCEKILNKVIEIFPNIRKQAKKLKYDIDVFLHSEPGYTDFVKYSKYLLGNPKEDEISKFAELQYYWEQITWLLSRFPNGIYTDVGGLCKIVTLDEVKSKDYSLTPGRFVGVEINANDSIDYKERLKDIHIEISALNEEASKLLDELLNEYRPIYELDK